MQILFRLLEFEEPAMCRKAAFMMIDGQLMLTGADAQLRSGFGRAPPPPMASPAG